MLVTEQSRNQITQKGSQLVHEQKKQGFELIWYYWYLKNFANKSNQQQIKQPKTPSTKQKQLQVQKPSSSSLQIPPTKQKQPQAQKPSPSILPTQQIKPLTLVMIQSLLRPYRQSYQMQTIETHLQHSLSTIKQRALLSRNDRFFVIEPQQQIRQIEYMIRNSSVALRSNQPLQSCLQEMLLQLYSYYLNSKNVYLIYKGTSQSLLSQQLYQNNSISSSMQSTQNRLKMILTHNSSQSRLNTSKDSKGSLKHQRNNQRRSYDSLKSSLIISTKNNLITTKLLQDDSILTANNVAESLVTDGEKIENKIEELEVIDRLAEFDGLELWSIKYKKIPHTFLKFKKQSWTKCLNLPLMHPSAPKTINEFPILPRLSKLNPSIDKLLPFVSFIKLLQKFFPNLLPSIDSIFQYNGLPYVFLQQDNGYGSWKWETNIGVLCYFVVFGNQQQTLSIKKVQRWVEQNPDSLLAKTIKQMTKRQKEKNKKRKELLKNIPGTTITANLTDSKITTDAAVVNASLTMLIARDENSDLAIW